MQAREMTNASKALRQTFCAALSSGVTEASTSTWQVTASDEPSGRAESLAAGCFRFRFHGSLEGVAFLVLPPALSAKLNLRDAAANPDEAAQATGLLKALQGCATRLGELLIDFGTVTVEVESVESPELPEDLVFDLWAQSDPDDLKSRHPLHLCLSGDLVASLQPTAAEPFVFPDAARDSDPANLDLVMDVELNVTLRFGQRQMALRDVLELNSGSVVELDRLVDEPVELILDGRIVARGEAVIIDGNYGMRITEVLQQVLT